jgi:hypothetical protein
MRPPICRRIGILVLTTVVVTVTDSRAFAQQPFDQVPFADAKFNAILEGWLTASSQVKTLTAKFKRIDRRPLHAPTEYEYQIRWKNSGLASISIEQTGRKRPSEFDARIVWTGSEVWEYRVPKKEITVYKDKDLRDHEVFRLWLRSTGWGRFAGNQFDTIFLALGNPKVFEPLTFVIGMKEVVDRRQFTFELFDRSDPERLVIRATLINPAQNTTFDHIFITLDRARFLPVAIEYQKGWGGKDSRQFTLVSIELDRPIDDSVFVPQKPAGWTFKAP